MQPSTKRVKSQAWKWFTPLGNYDATCNICGKLYSYRGSVSNLSKHLIKKHRNTWEYSATTIVADTITVNEVVDADNDDNESPKARKFNIQKYFELTENDTLACCKQCNDSLPNDSVDDLIQHIVDHGGFDDGISYKTKPYTERRNKSYVWRLFSPKDDQYATCNLCGKDYMYKSSISNLSKHLRQKHNINRHDAIDVASIENTDTDEDDVEDSSNVRKFSARRYYDLTDDGGLACCKLCNKNISNESMAELIKHIVDEHGDCGGGTDAEGNPDSKFKQKSMIWLYFKPNPGMRKATCLICREGITYGDNAATLRYHMEKQHPSVQTASDITHNKKLLVTANGDMYEIESEVLENNNFHEDDSKDPIQMDTVYLEDFDEDSDSLNETKRSNEKKMRASTHLKSNKSITRRYSDSDDEYLVRNNRSKDKEMDRIDLFGQYLVTLLKELPKRLSDELQASMIKQVMTAKHNYETQSVDQNHDAPKSPVTVPVMAASVDVECSDVNEVTDSR